MMTTPSDGERDTAAVLQQQQQQPLGQICAGVAGLISVFSFWSRIFEIEISMNKMADFRQTKTDRATSVTNNFVSAATFAQMPSFTTKN